MASTSERSDPFFGFRFEISIDGMAAAGFSECTGLQINTEFQDYMEGGVNTYVHKLPTRTKQSNITLKRGVVSRELWDWYDGMVRGNIEPKNCGILVYDPQGQSIEMQWELDQVLPVKWEGPSLNATQNSVAVESIELSYYTLRRDV